LVLDILLDGIQRSAAAGNSTVTRRPEVFTPQFIFELFPVFLAKKISRFTLQLSHQVRDGTLGWERKQQMDMIIFPVKFMQGTTHLITGFGKKVFQPGKHIFGKNITPVFCYKDKM
jgi:hypothetical protein